MQIKISQIIRSRRKTLAIIIKNDGELIVRAPMRTPDQKIKEFVEEHHAWIEKKQTEIESVVLLSPKQYVPGEMFMFLGESYPLEIVKDQEKSLVLNGSFNLAEEAAHRAEAVFERWYRGQAKRILKERVDFYVSQYGFEYQGIKITSAKTR